MRAAVSYHYAQQDGRGSEKWHQDRQGTWLGNPALSHAVSRYMISLQRRKVGSQLIVQVVEMMWFNFYEYRPSQLVKTYIGFLLTVLI
jgi:hypothetical protein